MTAGPPLLERCPNGCRSEQVERITEQDHVVWNRVEVSPGAIATRVWYRCPLCKARLKEIPE